MYCTKCNGSKRQESRYALECGCDRDPHCTICGGSGIQTIIEYEDCSHCNGSGEEPEEE